jgi:hypothetical protein
MMWLLNTPPMRFALIATVVVLLSSPAWPQTVPNIAVIGTWEGESKCIVRDSPCHDEHVVYRIVADKKYPAQLNIDADKIVNGSPQFMGTIFCQYHPDEATLSCTANTAKKDDWEFHISANTMTGTLTVGREKQLFRRISVHKTAFKAS